MSAKINRHATGIYMAFPTTPMLKPIYRKLKTQVNEQHTKVGVTTDSFANREREYKRTFGGEVEFVPLVELPAQQLASVEAVLLQEMCSRYRRVGRAREWFDTVEREAVVQIVLGVVARSVPNAT